ncbi:MAG: hypothetical protein J0L82_05945 [Deltaproteobacteria bacterium]|nr:hypothetical protein [Deltaproteobacteria bacterium]
MKRHTAKSAKKDKKNVKSSITLPPAELEIVNELMTKLEAKSKVDVIRQGLALLKLKTDRDYLAAEFRRAAEINREDSQESLDETHGVPEQMIPQYDEEYKP